MRAIAENRRARYDYEITETFEAGIELKGFEVKSLMTRGASLGGAYAAVRGGEVWLLNVEIPPYQPKNTPKDYDPMRTRRLLIKQDEIKRLVGRTSEKGLTLLPIKMYKKGSNIKVLLGLGRAKSKKDKREKLKRREAEREMRG